MISGVASGTNSLVVAPSPAEALTSLKARDQQAP